MSNGSPWPRVTIITPSFNQGQFIEETIRSVILQNYPNLEYIVIDGGSSDSTIEVIEKYEASLTHWETKTDRGQSHAINKGLLRCSGDIVSWLCSDDMLLEGALASVAGAMKIDEPSWVIGGAFRKDERSGHIRSKPPPKKYTTQDLFRWRSNSLAQSSVFWNRALQLRAGNVREDLDYCMDLDLWFRFFQIAQPSVLPFYLSQYRHHALSKTTAYSGTYNAALSELSEWCLNALCELRAGGKSTQALDAISLFQGESAAMNRLRQHPVFGRMLRFWKSVINPSLPI